MGELVLAWGKVNSFEEMSLGSVPSSQLLPSETASEQDFSLSFPRTN